MQLSVATKRLATTFQGVVGPLGAEGSFQDLMRFVIAAAYSYSMHKGHVLSVKPTDKVDWDSHRYNPGVAMALHHCQVCRTHALWTGESVARDKLR